MFVVTIGALTSDAQFFGPYGEEEIAERARDELAQQGHEGQVRPLTNGLRAYRDMRGAAESHADDPFNDWTRPEDAGLPVTVISDEGVTEGTLNADDSITVGDDTVERALAALERVRDTLDTIRTGDIEDRAEADGVIEECEGTLERAAENLERLTKRVIDSGPERDIHVVTDGSFVVAFANQGQAEAYARLSGNAYAGAPVHDQTAAEHLLHDYEGKPE